MKTRTTPVRQTKASYFLKRHRTTRRRTAAVATAGKKRSKMKGNGNEAQDDGLHRP